MDGSLVVEDKDIFHEIKKRCGKESLDVNYDIEGYRSVEEMIKTEIKERESVAKRDFLNNCGHENSDLRIEEVEAAISQLSNNSAPSREE